MDHIRKAFLEACDFGRTVLMQPQVVAHWDAPSALPEYTVRGLAGHLVRAVTTVVDYLAAPEPNGPTIAPPAYLAGLTPAPDLTLPQQAAIRERGEQMAAGGWDALVARLDSARAQLAEVLALAPAERKVSVLGNQAMLLDDYLPTRVVELLVHSDDLAVSVDLKPLAPPSAAADLALHHLLDVARLRSGDLAVLRAFSRRERDHLHALRVF